MGTKRDSAEAGPVEKCTAPECKVKPVRFGFCGEHFDQYKFGLIRKTGEKVPDFDKKIDHYAAFKKGVAGRKVA